MNKRMLELAEQATSSLSVKHEGYGGKGYTEQVEFFDKEKFAELIVRECAEVAANVVAEHEGVDFGLVEKCYKHFGVEE